MLSAYDSRLQTGHAPARPADYPLSARDFHFAFHPRPERFFKGPRPLRLIQSPPAITKHRDVIYKPSTRGWYPFTGCLYDESLRRIEATCLKRWRTDLDHNMEPARYDGETKGLPTYDRPLLYLGFLHPSYGHFLLEVLSYWWPLITEQGKYDRFLIHTHDRSVLESAYVKAILAALNIKAEQLVSFDKPTRLRHVVVPDPSVQLNSHIHDQYRMLMERIATGLGAADHRPTDQPLYVSRSKLDFGKDRYIGEEKLEAWLEQRGARVIHPQLLPFPEQVRIFNEHSRILGMIGSAMHNIVLALQPKTLTYFTTHLINDNFFIVDKRFDADSTYVNACTSTDRYRVLLGDLTKGITGRRKRAGGFLTGHELDVPRMIDWLNSSGQL